jgi:hypothetical protein
VNCHSLLSSVSGDATFLDTDSVSSLYGSRVSHTLVSTVLGFLRLCQGSRYK